MSNLSPSQKITKEIEDTLQQTLMAQYNVPASDAALICEAFFASRLIEVTAPERFSPNSESLYINRKREKIITYLRKHFGELNAVKKIINLDSLNEKDLSELQEVLNSLKNPVDNTENFNNTQELIIFIRKIIGLDKKAIDEKCAKFLNNNDFNKEQRQLINLIIDFAIRNGNVTAEDLVNEQPFCDIPIQEMFDFDIRPLIQLVNVFNSPLIVSAAA